MGVRTYFEKGWKTPTVFRSKKHLKSKFLLLKDNG